MSKSGEKETKINREMVGRDIHFRWNWLHLPRGISLYDGIEINEL